LYKANVRDIFSTHFIFYKCTWSRYLFLYPS